MGAVSNIKKKVVLVLRIASFDYDGDADTIRINGINAQESKYLKMGAS